MYKLKISLLIYLLALSGCSHKETLLKDETDHNERFVLATIWMETAAECKALQIQAYNIARLRVEQYMQSNALKGNEAVVLDIDETVLETSLYQTKMIINGISWPTGWQEFIDEMNCEPVAGSLEFLKFIDSLGLKIFYVSNRNENERASLIGNLQKYNYPQINNSNILLKTAASGKEERRNYISSEYNILLLIGDNLGDFSDVINRGSYIDRANKVLEMSSYFGDKYIILPNPAYGDWEGSLSPGYWNLTPYQRDSIRKEVLRNLLNDK